MNRFYRGLFTLTLLLGLLIGLVGPSLIQAMAAPMMASLRDVIISEVAWGGTAANPADEWIELYNPTGSAIDMSGWTLVSSDTTPSITLTGSIPANGYYLLESGDDFTVSDIIADQIYTGSLVNAGETLTLTDNLSNIIDTANSSGGGWDAGSGSPSYSSMERIGVLADIAAAWADNDGITRNGLDAGIPSGCTPNVTCTTNPQPINGTPKQINSATISFNLTATASATSLTGTASVNQTGTAGAFLTGTAEVPLTGTAAANLTSTATGWTPTFTGLPPTATPTITLTPTITTPVISEVAWAGTKASSTDEWIELYNPGYTAVDLTDWQLVAKDGLPLIPLSGTILAGGFYLIERGDDRVVKDVPADLVYTFDPLSDEGETLYLKNASRTVIDSANKSGTAWPAGQTGGNFPTMERTKTNGQIAPDGPFAWITNNGTVKNGHDAAGHAIYGTPKQANWPISITMTPTRTVTPTGTVATPTRTGTPTPTATPTLDIIINEVAWMGTIGSHDDEWIELYNPTNVEVDLSDWRIKSSTDNSPNILLTGKIPANGYYIIAPVGTFEDGVTINQIESFDLSDNGKSLQLISSSTYAIHPNTVIDTANSNGGLWSAGVSCPSTSVTPAPEPAAHTCATMERHSTGWSDSDWFTFDGTEKKKYDRYHHLVRGTPGYANWAASVTATPTKVPTSTLRPPTARATNLPPIVATLVINEFLPRAGFDWNEDGKVDVFDEYIEIANLGPIDANLANWKLDDMPNGGSNPYTLPARTLKPGEHAIFYASQTNVLLGDGGDTVRLLNPNNVIKDAHTYSLVKVADQSICRIPDINGSWYTDCVPTPNARNSRTGTVPSAPPGTGLEEPLCQLPDTLPPDFQLAECYGFGSNMWNPAYWDGIWQGDRSVPQNGSKWDTFIE